MRRETGQLKRVLNYWDVAAVAIGIIVGSGIFITPSLIARNVPSLAGILALWIAGGLLSLFGAMAYAELGAALPRTGGHYAFAREAYGPLIAFLFGWAYLLIGYPCSLAGIAAIFGLYASHFVPMSEAGIRLTAAGAILAVAVINYLGVRESSILQRLFAYGKVAALLVIVLAGFFLGKGTLHGIGPTAQVPVHIGAGAIVAALVGVMWTYDGWCDATPIAGEVQNPGRDMGKGLFFGMLAVIAIYAIVNLAYFYLLPFDRITSSPMVAAD
ncbi:MAG TPA: amino acid permease, partial [Bacteroidetes bacterium]|nr:amino acid permease [Bacteroidota bacterium]